MKFNMEKDGSKLTIAVEGRLDTITTPELETELEPALAGVTELVFDLRDLEYISSAGLRVLLTAAQVMEDQGKMTVINVRSEVMEIFKVTGFVDILTIK